MVGYDDIRKAEALLRHDLSFRRQLRPSPPSRSSLSHIASNRHATGTRIELMDRVLQEEALVSGAPPSPLGDAYL